MSKNVTVDGFDELAKKLDDPETYYDLIESHLEENFDIIIGQAKQDCQDIALSERIHYSLDRMGDIFSVHFGPREGLNHIFRAHDARREDLSDVANQIMDRLRSDNDAGCLS